MTNELQIRTHINSSYNDFDLSGQLPFAIVFGLRRRRSQNDTEARPLLLKTGGSVLDVPYALTHGLLNLYERDHARAKDLIKVDLSSFEEVPAKGLDEEDCISLSPATDTTKISKLDAYTVYKCRINVDDEWISVFKPGKKYTIRLASTDLGLKRWAFGDQEPCVRAVKLISNESSTGSANFKVVKNLPWPPRVEMRLRLCTSSSSSSSSPSSSSSVSAALEVSVTNTNSEPVTVQVQGHQNFLLSWGPFEPEYEDMMDRLPRIIHPSPYKSPTSSLEIIDLATREPVQEKRRGGCKGLIDYSRADLRPSSYDLLVLEPDIPILKIVDIADLLRGLNHGQDYGIRMQSRGCTWWSGDVKKDAEEAQDKKLPIDLCRRKTVPLILETQDEVNFCIRDGKVESTTE